MRSRIEFNVKDIEYIQFTPVKQVKWRYFEFIPEKRILFGVIRTQKALYDGWSINGEPWYSEYGGWCDWRTTNSLKGEFFQRVEGNNEPWYDYANVYIKKLNSSFNQKFKSNGEALEFIEELKELSGDNFKIIYND
jgi:hypothetical protein